MSVKKHTARLAAVQALYQFEMSEEPSWEEVRQDFLENRLDDLLDQEEHATSVDKDLFVNLFDHTVQKREEIDGIIEQNLSGDWKLERIEKVLRSILRVGICELLTMPQTPAKVVITEYVKLTKSFFDGDESGFVNRVLDQIAHVLRSDEF